MWKGERLQTYRKSNDNKLSLMKTKCTQKVRKNFDDDDDDDCFYIALFSALEQTHCARL